jgi:hypothetical protein
MGNDYCFHARIFVANLSKPFDKQPGEDDIYHNLRVMVKLLQRNTVLEETTETPATHPICKSGTYAQNLQHFATTDSNLSPKQSKK